MQTKLLTVKEVAERLNVSVGTIRNWVRGCYSNSRGPTLCKVKFIEPVRIGRLLQFKESDLNRWIAAGAAC